MTDRLDKDHRFCKKHERRKYRFPSLNCGRMQNSVVNELVPEKDTLRLAGIKVPAPGIVPIITL